MRAAVAELSQRRYTFADLPRRLQLAGAEFLVVNTSAPSNLLCSWGFLRRREREFILDACAGPHEKPRILVTHYPMTEDHPILRLRHRLFGQKKIVAEMQKQTLDLVLCGHVHRPYLKIDAQGRGECCAGSVTRNGSLVEIECDPAARSFVFRTVEL